MCCCTLIWSRCDRVEVNRATDSRAIRISYLLTLVLTDPGSLCAVCQRANAASTHAWMGRVNTCWYSKCTNTYAVSCLNIGRGEIWTSKMRSKIKISIFIPEDEASIVTWIDLKEERSANTANKNRESILHVCGRLKCVIFITKQTMSGNKWVPLLNRHAENDPDGPHERGFTLNHIKCPSFPFNVELHRRSNNYKVSKQRVFHIPLHNRMQSGQKKTKKIQ